MRFHLKAFFLFAICTAAAFGQSYSMPFGALRPNAMRDVVASAAYSGEQVSEMVRTLADGTNITTKAPSTKVYRDSPGRTRSERCLVAGTRNSPALVEITDPVAQAKYTYLLDSNDKVAHRQRLPSPAATSAKPATGRVTPPPVENRTQIANERLGTRTIEGILAEGTRHTTTWPVDSIGNDRPISSVNETWMSSELKVMILSKNNDPRIGEGTIKLINISRDEPSASLFQVPPEYTVVDEEGDFTIKFGLQ